MRRILRLLGWSVAVLLLGVALLVGHGHWRVRQAREPLPWPDEIARLATAVDRPVRVAWVNTASQAMPRAGVLDVALDPDPTAPYVMSHPSFVLEWADGRILLIDLGMTRDGAIGFGRLLERMGGAQPIEPRTTVAAALGPKAAQVRGVVFTHLHDDHVGGLQALCEAVPGPVPVFMNGAQMDSPTATTYAARRLIATSACVREQRLQGGALLPLDGFPGVGVIHVAGHTPGSQVVVAYVGSQGYVFAGDVVNNVDGLRRDLPKPFLYSLLMVPEDRDRLGEVRRFLRALHDDRDLTLVPAHDQLWIEQTGIPAL